MPAGVCRLRLGQEARGRGYSRVRPRFKSATWDLELRLGKPPPPLYPAKRV